MKRRQPLLTPPPVTVRRWTGDEDHDRAQAWSHLSDDDLRRVIATKKPAYSVPGARAELKRRHA